MSTITYSNYDTYTAEKLMERKRKSRKIKEDRQAVVGAVIGSFAMIGIFAGMIAFYIAFGYPLQKVGVENENHNRKRYLYSIGNRERL